VSDTDGYVQKRRKIIGKHGREEEIREENVRIEETEREINNGRKQMRK
jgi:hypothetical protein